MHNADNSDNSDNADNVDNGDNADNAEQVAEKSRSDGGGEPVLIQSDEMQEVEMTILLSR